jgi:hypothetical protein
VYDLTLIAHSWVRWAVLLTGIAAIVRGTVREARIFTTVLDIQIMLGLLLYFVLSPFTTDAIRNMGAAMQNSALRYWAVEHVFGMIVGAALAHVGAVRMRKVDEWRRRRVALIFFGLALVAIAASIPWPMMPNGRPLFRW